MERQPTYALVRFPRRADGPPFVWRVVSPTDFEPGQTEERLQAHTSSGAVDLQIRSVGWCLTIGTEQVHIGKEHLPPGCHYRAGDACRAAETLLAARGIVPDTRRHHAGTA